MDYNLFEPWKTLDQWQKDYIAADGNCFLLSGRQCGKTTAMSIKAVELCIKKFKKGEFILITSITEKQAYHMLAKALAYTKVMYPHEIKKGKDKPTLHKLLFKNGTGILCYAAGEAGDGLRGYTIKKLMNDEASRMSEEYFIATMPALSVIGGTMDVASTPFGKRHKDGTIKFFYKCSKDTNFKKFYVSAEDCPRHDKEFLKKQKETMSKLHYAQEYLAVFTDELKRLFDDELIKNICTAKRKQGLYGDFFLGVDVAGLGEDDCAYTILERTSYGTAIQRENIIEKRNYTTDTTRRILHLDQKYKTILKMGIDDGGVGFGVFSELYDNENTRGKVKALNNASREVEYVAKMKVTKEIVKQKSKRLLKEDMYFNLLSMMEHQTIRLLDDEEVKLSLQSIQHDDGKIFGSYSHITEAIIRAAWLLKKDKSLNMWIR